MIDLCLLKWFPPSWPSRGYTSWLYFDIRWPSTVRSIEYTQCLDISGPRCVSTMTCCCGYLLSLIECRWELYRCLKVCALSRCSSFHHPRCHGRLIHHRLHLALAVQRAVVLYAAVARPSTSVVLAHGLTAFKDGAVMLPDPSCLTHRSCGGLWISSQWILYLIYM